MPYTRNRHHDLVYIPTAAEIEEARIEGSYDDDPKLTFAEELEADRREEYRREAAQERYDEMYGDND